jgi:methyltransferase (TIGR00027 family)
MPEVLALRAERLLSGHQTTTSAIAVPIDFEREDLGEALRRQGYTSGARTLFLWEGVTYNLPVKVVRAVLSFVASQSEPGSSILFDYVTKAFVDGDYSGYGTRRLADGWRRLGDVNRCGIDDIEAVTCFTSKNKEDYSGSRFCLRVGWNRACGGRIVDEPDWTESHRCSRWNLGWQALSDT